MDFKPTNPKDLIASNKVPLHFCAPVAEAYWAVAMALGATKYGAHNFVVCGASAMVYVDALRRHVARWMMGEEYDPVDGTHHLANGMACIAIILECRAAGTLIDDRPPSVDLTDVYAECEAMMKNIRETYPDRKPRHYSIRDKVKPIVFSDPFPSDSSSR
jgi:hypothetical protein